MPDSEDLKAALLGDKRSAVKAERHDNALRSWIQFATILLVLLFGALAVGNYVRNGEQDRTQATVQKVLSGQQKDRKDALDGAIAKLQKELDSQGAQLSNVQIPIPESAAPSDKALLRAVNVALASLGPPAGSAGPSGPSGASGSAGPSGDTGASGSAGAAGEPYSGPPPANGDTGKAGQNGASSTITGVTAGPGCGLTLTVTTTDSAGNQSAAAFPVALPCPRSITSTQCQADGTWLTTYSDGTTENSGGTCNAAAPAPPTAAPPATTSPAAPTS